MTLKDVGHLRTPSEARVMTLLRNKTPILTVVYSDSFAYETVNGCNAKQPGTLEQRRGNALEN
jgi:hypothetical protein